MSEKILPFTKPELEGIIAQFPTSNFTFYVYDEQGIRESARRLNKAFSWVPGGFINHFAVKANDNPYLLKILREEGSGADCSEKLELESADAAGFSGEQIMLTSNNTSAEQLVMAKNLGAIINLDDIRFIPFMERNVGIPELICFRYNPGGNHIGNSIIGNPEEAKYGMTKEQIFEAYRIMKSKGVKRFGLHAMLASNELNPQHFVDTARMFFELAVEISREIGIKIEFINLGGGVGIPYKPGDKAVDLELVSRGIHNAYQEIIMPNGLHPLRVVMECGRLITGPHGYLITSVRHVMEKHRKLVGVDATMANLMRPGMYGPEGKGYHHITVLGKEDWPLDHRYDVVGSLCENNDKFAVQRALPKIEEGEVIAIYDAGAHAYVMGFNYNAKLRSPEFLHELNRNMKQIRRGQTSSDYFATLDFPGSEFAHLARHRMGI